MGKPLKMMSFWMFYVCIVLTLLLIHLMSSNKRLMVEISVENAIDRILEIHDAALRYPSDFYDEPLSLNSLEEHRYLFPDESVERQWKFTLHLPERITAESTIWMPGGSGETITYDIGEDAFFGYDCPEYGRMVDF